jgi:hypothetical protein
MTPSPPMLTIRNVLEGHVRGAGAADRASSGGLPPVPPRGTLPPTSILLRLAVFSGKE